MSRYVLNIRYTREGAKGINEARTKEAEKLLSSLGGSLVDGYGLLGRWDAMLIVELPDNKSAMKFAMKLGQLISASTETMPALPLAEFDALAKE